MADHAAVEARLRSILDPYRDRLELGTIYNRDVMRRPGGHGHDWFAGVVVNKNYVSFYLMPMYKNPQLVGDLSPALRKRKQGEVCFNFSTVDDELIGEVTMLTERSFEAYMRDSPSGDDR